jgi:hypothetical protein
LIIDDERERSWKLLWSGGFGFQVLKLGQAVIAVLVTLIHSVYWVEGGFERL